jgi:hypothetical protein
MPTYKTADNEIGRIVLMGVEWRIALGDLIALPPGAIDKDVLQIDEADESLEPSPSALYLAIDWRRPCFRWRWSCKSRQGIPSLILRDPRTMILITPQPVLVTWWGFNPTIGLPGRESPAGPPNAAGRRQVIFLLCLDLSFEVRLSGTTHGGKASLPTETARR